MPSSSSAFLRVAANESVKSAARISNIANSTATISACVAGLATRYLRRLKLVILAGTAIYTLGLGQPPAALLTAMALLTSSTCSGLMIRYRTATNSQAELAMVQIVRGIGQGCIMIPVRLTVSTNAVCLADLKDLTPASAGSSEAPPSPSSALCASLIPRFISPQSSRPVVTSTSRR